MKTMHLQPDHCPWCGYEIDAASPLEGDATPEPGNLTLCLECASILQFDHDIRLQKITDQSVREVLSAEDYERLMKVRRSLLSMDRRTSLGSYE